MNSRRLAMIDADPWLVPSEGEIAYRHQLYLEALAGIEQGGVGLADFANGYRYYGFQRDERQRGWWFREWLPGARDVYLMGDFNGWQRTELRLKKDADGVWGIFLADELFADKLVHRSLVKLLVHGADGSWRERIPAYARRVEQDEQTKNFTAQFWAPEPFDWDGDKPVILPVGQLLIYECHVGMATEREEVGSFAEFTEYVLPRVKRLGYTAVQLMGIAEHPYYGSFGYHVSNFFAVSSRFGTPEELKKLIRRAHELGLAVIMDIVHSHYVKNINEGLNDMDGSGALYSPPGEAGNHPHWDSKLFDYGRPEVRHFLLSNCKFWLEEFHFDGFRFDGVTSMCFYNHGFMDFLGRDDYFNENVNRDALVYLKLANRMLHELRPGVLTIAEDVSGMPGMCFPVGDGGNGFDYRLGMALPDYWIKILKEQRDEQWSMGEMWRMMTDRLPGVKTIAYAESHDQALVGDKTLAFRLMDKEMYTSMDRTSQSMVVDRGMALHKMIRLFTISTGGQGWLAFMGNEFGHPEWIDFPREGNRWSYKHARRQWSLALDRELRFADLEAFDRSMVGFVRRNGILADGYPWLLKIDEDAKTIVFCHGTKVFVFNWHASFSMPDYVIPVPVPGKYKSSLSTDGIEFGGAGREDASAEHFSFPVENPDGTISHFMKVYGICRTATVYDLAD